MPKTTAFAHLSAIIGELKQIVPSLTLATARLSK
jgi:hypothetical protein